MKRIAVIGSTGSIGTQTLDVVRDNDDVSVAALAAATDIVSLENQIREFSPKMVCVYSEKNALELRLLVKDCDVQIVSGMEGLLECVCLNEVSMVVMAVVGMIGIRPTIAAIEAGKDVALANKETLVTAGHLIMPLVKKTGVRLLPVDSEHSAIFQSLQGNQKATVEKILLTASGGPFRGKSRNELESVTIEDALKHPNWSMGKKITVDSATMVNKGLEVMEAKWLFDVSPEQIEVLIQPQSILHSAVQFSDGAVIGQMGTPDMKLPIQYAIVYPERRDMNTKRIDFFGLGTLTFERPNNETFPGLGMAYKALITGGNMPTVYNAANEYAVAGFINGTKKYLEITECIDSAMHQISLIENPTLDDILMTEQETYHFLQEWSKVK